LPVAAGAYAALYRLAHVLRPNPRTRFAAPMTERSAAQLDRVSGVLLGAAAGETLGGAEPGLWGPATAAGLATGRSDAERGHDASAGGAAALVEAALVAVAGLRLDPAGSPPEAFWAAAAKRLAAADSQAGEAGLLWCAAVHHALVTGNLDVRVGLARLGADRAEAWAARLVEAESGSVDRVAGGDADAGEILLAAWAVICATPVPAEEPREGRFRVQHLRDGLATADGGGVGAVTGSLLGAAYGGSAVPSAWRRTLHDGTGARAADLVAAAAEATGDPPPAPDYSFAGDQSALARHPHDENVWMGGYKALRKPPPGVDVLVSLCPVAAADAPPGVERIDVVLADTMPAADNPNAAFVLHDTAGLIQALRAEGRTVLVHGVRAMNRTPAVATAYAFRLYELPVSAALGDVRQALLRAQVTDPLRDALAAMAPVHEEPPAHRPILTRHDILSEDRRASRGRRGQRAASDWPEGRSVGRLDQ
jgi:hypothetical protein